jgi:hypothetical protein
MRPTALRLGTVQGVSGYGSSELSDRAFLGLTAHQAQLKIALANNQTHRPWAWIYAKPN